MTKTKTKTKMTMLVAAFALTACASAPKPVAVAEPNFTSNSVVGNMPGWFVKPPESSSTVIYTVGTAKSADLSMVTHKAVVDAQSNLAHRLAGVVDTLTKDYKREEGEDFSQTTEQATHRVATNVKVSGYTVVDKIVIPEGRGYRSYVLVKYPVVVAPVAKVAVASHQSALAAELTALKTAKVGIVPDDSGIVIRETLASDESMPLGVADAAED